MDYIVLIVPSIVSFIGGFFIGRIVHEWRRRTRERMQRDQLNPWYSQLPKNLTKSEL